VNLEKAIKQTDDSICYARERLANRCRDLVLQLTQLFNKLESDQAHSRLCINDLGEIQSAGNMIDAGCGRLSAKIKALETLRNIQNVQSENLFKD